MTTEELTKNFRRGWPTWLLAIIGVSLVGVGFTLPDAQIQALVTGGFSLFSSWAMSNRQVQQSQREKLEQHGKEVREVVAVSADTVTASADTVATAARTAQRAADAVLVMVADVATIKTEVAALTKRGAEGDARHGTHETRIAGLEDGQSQMRTTLVTMGNDIGNVKEQVGTVVGLVKAMGEEKKQ